MATSRKIRRWEQIRQNPTLHRRVLAAHEFGLDFPWHDQAHLPQSSQAFCVSAFGTLRYLRSCNQVISKFLNTCFPELAAKKRPRRWTIELEASRPELLGEHGPSQPTSIDALCKTSQAVVCVESKFLTDARQGFGADLAAEMLGVCGDAQERLGGGLEQDAIDNSPPARGRSGAQISTGVRPRQARWARPRSIVSICASHMAASLGILAVLIPGIGRGRNLPMCYLPRAVVCQLIGNH